MTERGDARRARLGPDTVAACAEAARRFPPLTPEQTAALIVILRKPHISDRSRTDAA